MNKKLIQKRIAELRVEQQRASQHLQDLDTEKQKTVNELLIRNGRILELVGLLGEKFNGR